MKRLRSRLRLFSCRERQEVNNLAVVKNMIVRVGADLSGLISGFGKASGATGSFAKQTEKAMKNSSLSLGNLKKAMAQGGKNAAIVSLTDQIRELEAEQKALKAAGFSWGYEGFEGNEALLRDLKSQLNDYIRSLDETGDETEETTRKTRRLGAVARSALGWMKNAASNVLGFGKNAKSSTAGLESLVRSIRRIGLVSVGLRLVKSIFGELQSVVTQYISQNAALQAQVTALKTSLGQALAPAINLVTNALSALMPYVVGISNAIGSLISNLFGSGWTTVADGADAAAKAIGGAGGAQKEFNRQLAGFDEITKLNAESGGGGGGGSSATSSATEGKTPAWLTSLSEQIQQAASQGDFFGVGAALANAVNTGINSINLSDATLGSKIADLINGGVAGATGFVETLDWSGLGTAIKKNIAGLINGIDYKGWYKLIGSLSGGIASAIGALFSDAVSGAKEYFSESIKRCGGDILAGVLLGIVEGIASIGTWIKDNMFAPFVEGFKNTFKIHSPSQHKDITSLGKNIMLGIFEGITEPLRDPVGWIKKNIFAPLSQGFASVFGEDSMLAKSVSKLFFGDESFGRNLEVDVEANITEFDDKLTNKFIPFEARLIRHRDSIPNKKLTGYSVDIRKAYDNISNKTISNGRLTVTTMTDRVSNKVLNNGRYVATSMTDNVSNKVLNNGRISVNSWTDNIGNKVLTFAANVTKGWSGSIASVLGIASITSTIYPRLPTIEVKKKYVYDKVMGGMYVPSYSYKFNAKGGILNAAAIFGKIGNTLQVGGEAGREALLPLDRNTWWMDKIADRVALRVTGGSQSGDQNITVNLVLDGKIVASTVVRHVNAQARSTGKHPFAAYI